MPNPGFEGEEGLRQLQDALRFFHLYGNKREAAQAAGLSESTFRNRLMRAQLDPRVQVLPEEPPPKPRVRVKSGGQKRISKIMVIGDAHDHPDIPKDRFHWMARFAGDVRPDYVVQIGDFFTLDSLCSHVPNDTIGGKLKPPFMRDVLSAREALAAFQEGLPSGFKAPLHVTLGNHEDRCLSHENRHPESEGMFSGEIRRALEEHDWTWSGFGNMHFVEGIGLTHIPLNKMGRPFGGKNAHNTIANESVFDIVHGHAHTGGYKPFPKIGDNVRVTIYDAGCALPHGHMEHYANHTAGMTGWQYGVNILTVYDQRIIGHQFMPMLELEASYG